MTDPIVESHNAESANAAAVAEEARQRASASQSEAAFASALENFFNRGVDGKRFVDIKRIPFICDDIRGIHETMNTMNTTLILIRNIVFGFISTILLGVIALAGTVMVTVLSNHIT